MNNYGRAARDGDGNVLQKAAGFTTHDGSAMPQQSPIEVTTVTEVEVVIPDKCAEIVVCSDEAVWLDNDTGVTKDVKGVKIIASTYVLLGVTPGDSIFLIADTATADVSILYKNLA